MTQAISLLAQHADRLAAAAAEASDAVEHAALLAAIARDLAGDAPVDARALREGVADDTRTARLLRALLFECVELFRNNLDEAVFGDAVSGLRARFFEAIPRPPVDAHDREFYRRLMDNESGTDDARYAQLYSLFRSVSQGMTEVIYVHDLNGMFLYINPPALQLTKFTKEDVFSGLSIYDLIAPESLETIEARMEMPGATPRAPYTAEVYAKDGTRIALELSTRILRKNRKIAGVVGVARDLRLARRLESEVHRANAYLDALTRHAPMGIVLTDPDGAILDINPAAVEMLGGPGGGAMIGMNLFALMPDARAELRRWFAEAKDGGAVSRPLHVETSFGASLAGQAGIVPVAGDGSAGNLLLTMVDLSLQETLQRNLLAREHLAALGEVMAGVAHEVSNPLTIVIGYAQTLQAAAQDAQVRARLDNIVREANRCRRAVQNLVNFAQPRMAGKTYQDVNQLLDQVLSLRGYQLRAAGVEVEARLEPSLPPVVADGQALQRAFLALVVNAEEALTALEGRPKRLDVATSVREDRVLVRIGDSGPGIPESILPKVFDPFFTTKGTRAPGLGLTIARQIAEDHGGLIAVDTTEGEGAAFTVFLPMGGGASA